MPPRCRTPHIDTRRSHESLIGERRVEMGYTIARLSREANVPIGTISALQSGVEGPFKFGRHERGEIRPVVLRLCDMLQTTPEEMFPRYICSIGQTNYLTNDQLALISTSADMRRGGRHHVEHRADKVALYQIVVRAVKAPPKQSARRAKKDLVILLWWAHGRTLEEIGQRMGLSRQRVKQKLCFTTDHIKRYMAARRITMDDFSALIEGR